MKEVFFIAKFADALAESIHDVESSQTLLKHAQISTLDIEFSHRPRDNWWNIIQYCAYQDGAIDQLLEAFKQQFPNHSIFEMWQSGGGRNPVLDKKFGAPEMASGGDYSVSPAKNLKWFENTLLIAKNVGLVTVKHRLRQGLSFCTGFLLRDNYFIAPSFCLNKDSFENSTVTMSYINEGAQKILLNFKKDFLKVNEALHYCIVKVNDPENKLIGFRETKLDKAYSFKKETEMTIVSHMLGKSQTVNSGTMNGSWREKVFYDTTSDGGSSGAPIIVNGKVVAMHVANGKRNPEGLQVNEDGRKENWQMGIQIGAILEDAKLDL